MHSLKNFYTPLSGAPQKCFQSGPALAYTGPGQQLYKTQACSEREAALFSKYWKASKLVLY